MTTKISTKKIFFFIFILNLVSLLWFGFFFNKIKAENREIYKLNNSLSNKILRESELRLADDNLKETINERKKINSYFVQPGKEGVAKFVEDLEEMGGLADVSLKVNSIILKDKELGDGEVNVFEEMKLSFVIEGEWNKLVYFLELISSFPYELRLDKVYFEKTDKKGISLWSGRFNISVLKLKD